MPLSLSTPNGLAYCLPAEGAPGLAAMLAALAAATSTIHLEMFNLSHPELCTALGAAATRGVTVSVIMDESQGGGPSGLHGLHIMLLAGVPARSIVIATSEIKHNFDHRKTCVLDGKTIIDGSTNWSLNAFLERNSLLIFEDEELAAGLVADHEQHRAWALQAEAQYQTKVTPAA